MQTETSNENAILTVAYLCAEGDAKVSFQYDMELSIRYAGPRYGDGPNTSTWMIPTREVFEKASLD